MLRLFCLFHEQGNTNFSYHIVKILNLSIILLCTHLYHTSYQYLSITCNAFNACFIRCKKYVTDYPYETCVNKNVRQNNNQLITLVTFGNLT